LVNEDTNVLGDEVERIAAILFSTSCFYSGESQVSPAEPHCNALWMMLRRTRDAMTSPSKLRLFSAFVNAPTPHPAVIGITDIYLGPEFECTFAFFLKQSIDIE
jgi:hypothetical protein